MQSVTGGECYWPLDVNEGLSEAVFLLRLQGDEQAEEQDAEVEDYECETWAEQSASEQAAQAVMSARLPSVDYVLTLPRLPRGWLRATVGGLLPSLFRAG